MMRYSCPPRETRPSRACPGEGSPRRGEYGGSWWARRAPGGRWGGTPPGDPSHRGARDDRATHRHPRRSRQSRPVGPGRQPGAAALAGGRAAGLAGRRARRPGTAEAIRARYVASRRFTLSRIVLTLGACFVGLGLVWLVASNLDEHVAPRPVPAHGGDLARARRRRRGPGLGGAAVRPTPAPRSSAPRASWPRAPSAPSSSRPPRACRSRPTSRSSSGCGGSVPCCGPTPCAASPHWCSPSACWRSGSSGRCWAGDGAFAVVHRTRRRCARRRGRGRWSWCLGWRDFAVPWREIGALLGPGRPVHRGAARTRGATPRAARPSGPGWPWRSCSPLRPPCAVTGSTGSRSGSPHSPWRSPSGSRCGGSTRTCMDTADLPAGAWVRAVLAVVAYLVVASGYAVLGGMRDTGRLTWLATAALVVFVTVQAFAVFAPILSGAALFLARRRRPARDGGPRGPRPHDGSSPRRRRPSHEHADRRLPCRPRRCRRPRPARPRRGGGLAAALGAAHRGGGRPAGPAGRPARPVPRRLRRPRLPRPARPSRVQAPSRSTRSSRRPTRPHAARHTCR